MTGFWGWFHDAWEIVGALATAVAAIVALWIATRERKDRLLAEEERRAVQRTLDEERAATQRAARRAQAERVVAWYERRTVDSFKSFRVYQPTVRLGNFSDLPVFDVAVVAVRLEGNKTWTGTADVVPPTNPARTLVVEDVFEPEDVNVRVAVRFRDAAGVLWERMYDGRLVERSAADER